MSFPPAAPSEWTAPPHSLAVEAGWAHIFRLYLDLPAGRLAALRAHLSADELARAARYHFEIDRQRFTAARGQLREILSSYLGVRPESLTFTYNEHGKPALVEGEPRFNLSHSQNRGLLGVLPGSEIGVDVEGVQRLVDYPNIARRFFAPGEVESLFQLPAEDQPLAFFNCWTRKEAYIKARGQGLSIALDSFEVTHAPGRPVNLRAPENGWSIYALDPGPGFSAALVVEGQLRGIRCWDWR